MLDLCESGIMKESQEVWRIGIEMKDIMLGNMVKECIHPITNNQDKRIDFSIKIRYK